MGVDVGVGAGLGVDVGSGVEAAHPLRKMAGNKIMSWDFFIFCLSIKVWDARLYAWIFFYTPLYRMVFLENSDISLQACLFSLRGKPLAQYMEALRAESAQPTSTN